MTAKEILSDFLGVVLEFLFFRVGELVGGELSNAERANDLDGVL